MIRVLHTHVALYSFELLLLFFLTLQLCLLIASNMWHRRRWKIKAVCRIRKIQSLRKRGRAQRGIKSRERGSLSLLNYRWTLSTMWPLTHIACSSGVNCESCLNSTKISTQPWLSNIYTHKDWVSEDTILICSDVRQTYPSP